MKLLYSLSSPYARKVRIVAAEKRIEIEMSTVVLSAPDNPVNDLNPLGKVPVLVLDGGESLYDSRVIAEYLDNRTPVAHLLPQDPNQRILVKRWEASVKDHPAGNMHAFIGFSEIRKLEEAFLPSAEVLAKYEGSVGFQP